MNLGTARVAFRDRGIADVLDLALRFLSVHRGVVLRVSAVTLLPLTLISLLAGRVLGWQLAWAVALPLALLVDAPFTILASRLVFEDSVRARDVVAASLRAAPRILLARVITLVLVALGASFLLVPAIGVAAVTLFVSEAMLLERAPVLRAFSRAQSVASNALGDLVLAILVLALVPVGAVLLADIGGRTLIGEVLQFRPPPAVWSDGGSALGVIGLFLQVPFFATARFFLYLNVRTRTEGWDIQARFAGLAVRPDEGA